MWVVVWPTPRLECIGAGVVGRVVFNALRGFVY